VDGKARLEIARHIVDPDVARLSRWVLNADGSLFAVRRKLHVTLCSRVSEHPELLAPRGQTMRAGNRSLPFPSDTPTPHSPTQRRRLPGNSQSESARQLEMHCPSAPDAARQMAAPSASFRAGRADGPGYRAPASLPSLGVSARRYRATPRKQRIVPRFLPEFGRSRRGSGGRRG